MAEFIGREIEVGLASEETRGTAESTADHWVKKINANIIPRTTKVIDESTRGVLEDSQGSRVVRKWYEGELNGIVHADALGYLLKNLYGSLSTTETVSGTVYEHTFTLLESIEHPTLSIFRKDGSATQEVFGGGVLSTLEITANTEDFVRFTAQLMASSSASNSDTPSYSSEYDFIGKDLEVKIADTEAGLTGASALKLKTLTVRYDTGANSDFVFGSDTPDDVYNSRMSIEIEFTKNYTDTTFEDLFNSDDAKYMQIAVTGDADIGSGNNPSITWVFNKVQVQNWERGGDADSLVEETVTCKAFWNGSDGEQSTVTLQNLTATH